MNNSPKHYTKILLNRKAVKPSESADKPKAIKSPAEKTEAVKQRRVFRWELTAKELDSPRLKALEKKVEAPRLDILEKVKIQAEIDKEMESIFDARHVAQSQPKPKEENVTVTDNRHVYYDVKGEYTLMFWQGKAWIRHGVGGRWCWIVGLSDETYRAKGITMQQFAGILKAKLSYSQLQAKYQIVAPHPVDFKSHQEAVDYTTMGTFLNPDDIKAKVVVIK